jgi:hypothetical protein
MQLLDSWKRTLDFFERKNLALFGLVTLKAIRTVYGQIFKYLLLPIMCLACGELSGLIPCNAGWWQLILWVLRVIFLFLVYLSVRPSVEPKNWQYYRSYSKHALYILPWLGLIFLGLSYVGYWWWMLFASFIAFTVLFFVNSRPGCVSFIMAHIRALKMVLYNLPSVVVVSIILMILWSLYMVCIQLLRYIVKIPIADASFLFMPFEACVMANLYIMWLHEQFDIYFIQPK